MTVGMLMAALAFVCAAVIQVQIDVSQEQLMCWSPYVLLRIVQLFVGLFT